MIVKDEAARTEAIRRAKCDWCGRACPFGCDPAHIFSRGAGEVTAAWNLASLCRFCHTASHQGNRPLRVDLLAIAAQRHACLQDDIKAAVWCIRRLPKGASSERLKYELDGLTPAAAGLVRRVLKL